MPILSQSTPSIRTAPPPPPSKSAPIPSSSYPLVRMRKAVTSSGQIVGFALWKFYADLARNASAIGKDETESGDQGNESGTKKESKWPEGANVQLCEAVFRMSDEVCKLALQGKKYAGMLHFHFVYPPSLRLLSLGAPCMHTWQVHISLTYFAFSS
jgi:hypothetical protein